MKKDFTDITLLIDRSGSMYSCRCDAEGGINALIDEQRAAPGKAVLSVVEFENEINALCIAEDITKVGKYTLEPCGGTALLDAVGLTVERTRKRIADMPQAERPGLVVFVIATDGEENSSREYKLADVRGLIEERQDDGWQFVFIGANQDAFAEAGAMGFARATTADYSVEKAGTAYGNTSALLSRMRSQSAAGETVSASYSLEERRTMS